MTERPELGRASELVPLFTRPTENRIDAPMTYSVAIQFGGFAAGNNTNSSGTRMSAI
jgi:hypothetical protein